MDGAPGARRGERAAARAGGGDRCACNSRGSRARRLAAKCRLQCRRSQLRQRCRHPYRVRRRAHAERGQLPRRRPRRVEPQDRRSPRPWQRRRADAAGRQAGRRQRPSHRYASRRDGRQSSGGSGQRRPNRRPARGAQRQYHHPRYGDLQSVPGDHAGRLPEAAELVDHRRQSDRGSRQPAGALPGRAAAAVRDQSAASAGVQRRHQQRGFDRLAGSGNQLFDQEGVGACSPLSLANRSQPRPDAHSARLHRCFASARGQVPRARPAGGLPARRVHHLRRHRERGSQRHHHDRSAQHPRLSRRQRQASARPLLERHRITALGDRQDGHPPLRPDSRR